MFIALYMCNFGLLVNSWIKWNSKFDCNWQFVNLALAYTDILLWKVSKTVNICLFGSQRGNTPFIFLRKVNRLRILNDVSTNGTISNVFDASIAANGMVAWNQNVRHLKDKNYKISQAWN